MTSDPLKHLLQTTVTTSMCKKSR